MYRPDRNGLGRDRAGHHRGAVVTLTLYPALNRNVDNLEKHPSPHPDRPVETFGGVLPGLSGLGGLAGGLGGLLGGGN